MQAVPPRGRPVGTGATPPGALSRAPAPHVSTPEVADQPSFQALSGPSPPCPLGPRRVASCAHLYFPSHRRVPGAPAPRPRCTISDSIRPHGSVHGNPAAPLALQHWLSPSPVRSATSTARSLGTIRTFPSSLCQSEGVWLRAVTCPATEVLEQLKEPWGAHDAHVHT